METNDETTITVEIIVNASLEKAWECWVDPEHITQWAHASDDWHAPYAENNLRKGGKFKTTMAAKDGSFSFDFEGVYTIIKKHNFIEYMIGDGRMVSISFTSTGSSTKISETFEAENQHAIEIQQDGWQAILNNFKKYTEGTISN